jgi:hypothetical protein
MAPLREVVAQAELEVAAQVVKILQMQLLELQTLVAVVEVVVVLLLVEPPPVELAVLVALA